MKKLTIYSLVIAILFWSCKNNKPEEVVKTDTTAPAVKKVEPDHIKRFTAAEQTSSSLLTLRAVFERRILNKRPPKTKYFFDITYYDSTGKFYYIEQNPVVKPVADSSDRVPDALPYFYKYYPDTKKIVDAATSEEIK